MFVQSELCWSVGCRYYGIKHYPFTLYGDSPLYCSCFSRFFKFIVSRKGKKKLNIIILLPLAQRTEPYAVNNANRLNGRPEPKSSSHLQNENNTKTSFGGLSVSQTSDALLKETKTLGRLSVSQNSDVAKDPKSLSCKQFSFVFVFIYMVSLLFLVVIF